MKAGGITVLTDTLTYTWGNKRQGIYIRWKGLRSWLPSQSIRCLCGKGTTIIYTWVSFLIKTDDRKWISSHSIVVKQDPALPDKTTCHIPVFKADSSINSSHQIRGKNPWVSLLSHPPLTHLQNPPKDLLGVLEICTSPLVWNVIASFIVNEIYSCHCHGLN